MFTDDAQAIIDVAKELTSAQSSAEITLAAFLEAAAAHVQTSLLLEELLGVPRKEPRPPLPDVSPAPPPNRKLGLSPAVRNLLFEAQALANEIPDCHHPGLINPRHLVGALALSEEACAVLGILPPPRLAVIAWLALLSERDLDAPSLVEITEKLRCLRSELLSKVFGQDHAVQAFAEGLFNAEVVAGADTKRTAPRAVFVFAGPAGVGKTFLAELGSSLLQLPFKRFDMSAFSGYQQGEALVGLARSFQGAHPGLLTEFVEKNPRCVLLFDEIEKAHPNTLQLFLQVLDAGHLEDKFHLRNTGFRESMIIFTTNAGRKLYDRPNESGVLPANSQFHRKTILDALETEKDPQTGQPFFPGVLCSRMATGYPILFNRLQIHDLESVARAELERVGRLLERQYYKAVDFEALVAMCLVFREGGRADARQLRAQAEKFVKNEIFKFSELFKREKLSSVFDHTRAIRFRLEEGKTAQDPDIRTIFEMPAPPKILLVAERSLAALYCDNIPGIEWRVATAVPDALTILAQEDIDLVLLDLWVGRSPAASTATGLPFDHTPAAARALDQGQEFLRTIRERQAQLPIYLLSLGASVPEDSARGAADDELYRACIQGGGARGLIASRFFDARQPDAERERGHLIDELASICRRRLLEKTAARWGQEHKVLSFDTVPKTDPSGQTISILLRNFRLSRALAAGDTGELLDDVERPQTKFEDVIGAEAAKAELRFFIDYLKNPKRFALLKMKPPKAVLLHGPPGTGKTMLARALAGESQVAFLSTNASSFITIWQGSGPQSIRDLFARARRYAPAIIFIDEIDAVGKTRIGAPGAGRAEETTLNALLSELDGFVSPSPERPVFVLAATNFQIGSEEDDFGGGSPHVLDPALVRRFSRTILIDYPERGARLTYLNRRLENRAAGAVSPAMIDFLAERSSGMSIAALESFLEMAARMAVDAEGRLTDRILEQAFETARFGEARPRTPQDVRRTAYHEAGHAILYWLSGNWPVYITVVSRSGHGGYMAPGTSSSEGRATWTRDELLAQIRLQLAGRAGEVLAFGPTGGLSTGAARDLENATRLARSMICRYGMDEEFGLVAMPELLKYEEALSSLLYSKVNEAANKILGDQMRQTLTMLGKQRPLWDLIAEALVAKERLVAEELKQILPPLPKT
jgi:cell division protease FtsH